ncbi:MAG: GTPase Era [Gammaproteobacteria bacterium]|nr:GTPase Era [Gammaproteobacteria bacterium]MDH5692522.1 GTPase Era [Gammaproteobacteria bacterium]
MTNKRCGFISLTGRPNVGKSTLLNQILGQKLAITSPKPQTTRHRILGIKTKDNTQFLYVDTPGIHGGSKNAMNKMMNRTASRAVADVDIVIFVVDATRWSQEDQMVVDKICHDEFPVIIALNKVDKIDKKDELLAIISKLHEKLPKAEIIPLSAKNGEGVEHLEAVVKENLPESDFFFPEEWVTDRSDKFLTSELIREKLMRSLEKELPYHLTVEIEQFKTEKKVLHIGAIIWVERDSQKAIVIGKKGENLKKIGSQARTDLERMFNQKIFLQLWVKVKSGWSDDLRALVKLGIKEDE